MCGRFMFTAPIEAVRQTFGVEGRTAIPPRYNIAPTQPVLAVRLSEQAERELVALEWGLVPEWAKDRPEKPLVNARSETAAQKPSFRASVKRKRCLMPYTGWYEWTREDGARQPYLIRYTGEDVGAFAAIWSTWHGPSGDHWLETVALLTAEAKGELAEVHHRRPLAVKPEDFDRWLAPHDPLPRSFMESFDWVPEDRYETVRVSKRVNSVRFDDPTCAEPEAKTPSSPPAQGSLF